MNNSVVVVLVSCVCSQFVYTHTYTKINKYGIIVVVVYFLKAKVTMIVLFSYSNFRSLKKCRFINVK